MVRALRQLTAAGSRRNARVAAYRMALERRERQDLEAFLSGYPERARQRTGRMAGTAARQPA